MTLVFSPIKFLTASSLPTKIILPSFTATASAMLFRLSTVKINPFLKTRSADCDLFEVHPLIKTIKKEKNASRKSFRNFICWV